ncbi:MAG: GyrI-like domain-containing protein [Anaerolineae bacterium]|nr:GyrI-like domain-containing protein [Anaerolineae bacterium]
MEPQIVEQPERTIAGLSFYGDPFAGGEGWSTENEIGRLWNRFNAVWDERLDQISGRVNDSVAYEIHIEPPEYAETKRFYVFVGVEVERLSVLPIEFCYRVLPAGTYAVFSLVGPEIRSNWPDAIYKGWLPSSGYREAYKLTIERYGEGFHGMDDPTSELQIEVPIARAEEPSAPTS